jgi:NTP pyrophosphatase (non-canonical NTP hydrolase)
MQRTGHLLWVLAEECAEVAQRASKAARFGLTEVQPGQSHSNAERVMHEYADLVAAVEMLIEAGALPDLDLAAMKAAKKAKVARYLAYSQTCGTLAPDAAST